MLKIGVVGGTGKFGKGIVEYIISDENTELTAVITHSKNKYLGQDAGVMINHPNTGVIVSDDFWGGLTECDVIVDCCTKDAFLEHCEDYNLLKKPLVIGTTDIDEVTLNKIKEMSISFPISLCPNYSIEVYRFMKIVEYASKLMEDDVDVNIFDYHGKAKKDSPSGTAKRIVESIDKIQGHKEQHSSPIVHSIRMGNLIGEHRVLFVNNDNSEIEIINRQQSKLSYARGVIVAANWLGNKQSGLYFDDDIFGLANEVD